MSAHAGQMHSWIANISSATACFTICQTDRKKQLLLLFSFIVIVKKKNSEEYSHRHIFNVISLVFDFVLGWGGCNLLTRDRY